MDRTKLAAPAHARPLALLPAILVLAVTTHALLLGCGPKSQDSNAPTTNTTTPPPETPPAADTGMVAGDELSIGRKVYQDRCVLCHGAEGKGDGVAAAGLNPKPRNHTDGAYMSTRTDEDLIGVIRNGKGGMPAWGSILSEQEIQAVLKYVRSLAR